MNSIDPEELQALIQRIIQSGELGRSNTYGEILLYLMNCAIDGTSPKEIAIAIDVLGRDADFDVGKDSIVRVHIYHLRNKLKAYFEKYGKNEKFHLDIPKGQYILNAVPKQEVVDEKLSVTGKSIKRQAWTQSLAAVAIALLLFNLLYQYLANQQTPDEINPFASLTPWTQLFDDESPILILIGDYYIFAEADGRGDVARLVREFDVNSAEELKFLQDMGIERSESYFDISLNYIPSSIANALTQILPVILSGVDPSRIKMKMISEYTTADLAGSHIIYLGQLSGLSNLISLMFAGSGLQIGSTYDELTNLENGEYYVSSSGLLSADSYKDYGMLATFPSPNGYQVTMIAGMRDESLINLSEQVTSADVLNEINESLNLSEDGIASYEALFEVSGFDNTNFESRLVYSKRRDPSAFGLFFGGN